MTDYSGFWDALLERRGPHLVPPMLRVPAPDGGEPTACPHGHLGFCWDELTNEEQTNFCILHGYAYGWAVTQHGIDPGPAERWAGWFADMHYDEVVPMAGVLDMHTQFHIWAALAARLN